MPNPEAYVTERHYDSEPPMVRRTLTYFDPFEQKLDLDNNCPGHDSDISLVDLTKTLPTEKDVEVFARILAAEQADFDEEVRQARIYRWRFNGGFSALGALWIAPFAHEEAVKNNLEFADQLTYIGAWSGSALLGCIAIIGVGMRGFGKNPADRKELARKNTALEQLKQQVGSQV